MDYYNGSGFYNGQIKKRLGNKLGFFIPPYTLKKGVTIYHHGSIIINGDDRIIHKENGGACEARNVGLTEATGEYILIIDGDDWLEKRSVNKISCCV